MNTEKMTTQEGRDQYTNGFIDALPEYHREEFWVFLKGFEAAWELSGVPELPCDHMDIFDRYITGVIEERLKEERSEQG